VDSLRAKRDNSDIMMYPRMKKSTNAMDQVWIPSLVGCLIYFLALLGMHANAQQAIKLPVPHENKQPSLQNFAFASDGPIGPGWSRPDEIARTYFHEDLTALFSRTIVLSSDMPRQAKLQWIFTGPHAGFTVEITASNVRVIQRFYDSSALSAGQGNYLEKIVRDEQQQYVGSVRDITVVLDSHLAIEVLLNGVVMLSQPCTFDITRHQLMFSAPRTMHLTLAGSLLAPAIKDALIRVDSSSKHQTIIGFGGSPSIPAYEELSDEGKKQYWEILRKYNLLLDREYPMGTELKPDLSNLEDLNDATPHYYGDNFPNGEVSSFDYSKHAIELGGEVIYEMWALPKWATTPYVGSQVMDAWNRPVKIAANPDEYARIVVHYCELAKERTGQPPAIVGIENEVEQPPAIFDAMVKTLRHELDRAGFQSVKIHMADASYLYLGIARVHSLQEDTDAWRAIDYTAAHEYDYQEFLANPDLYDERLNAMHQASGSKPFLATEICLNDPQYQELSYRVALNVAQLYHKNLTELDAEALMYCWLLLDVEQPSFGGSRSLLVPDKTRGDLPVPSSFELRVMGAFSRHVLRGMTRVSASSPDPDLLVSAFEDSYHSSLIILNRSTEARHLIVDWKDKHWSEMERTSQTLENAASSPSDVIIQPGEIVTLSNFSVN
jgi:O-glycosyl hydrolase